MIVLQEPTYQHTTNEQIIIVCVNSDTLNIQNQSRDLHQVTCIVG